MGNSSATAASYAPVARAIPPEVKEFKDIVDSMLGRKDEND